MATVIIVDDETNACYNLKDIIENYIPESDIQIAGIATTTREAERLVNELKPDAIFLDIEMHEENGFQFLERISPFNFEIIFVTAYDNFAIKALKLNALDYILKPISMSELSAAILKLNAKLKHNRVMKPHEEYKDLSAGLKNNKTNNYIKLRTANAVDIVLFENILFVKAQGAYSVFYFKAAGVIKEVTTSYTIAEYEELLPPSIFFRVHRSFLVNCNYIHNLRIEANTLKIKDHQYDIPVSRRKMPEFLSFYNKLKSRT